MEPDVSVVIPTLDRKAELASCLEALAAQDLPQGRFEVIVVDGGSEDGSPAAARGLSGRLRCLSEPKKGAAAARNTGIRAAAGKLIAFTDDDCIPSPGWLSSLLSGLPQDDRCAAVGGDVMPFKENAVSVYAHHCGMGRKTAFGDRALHLPTTNALYRKKALLDVGCFEERLRFAEDTNLSLRIQRKGYYLRGIPGGLVLHRDPMTIPALYGRFWNYGYGVAQASMLEGKQMRLGWGKLLRELALPDRTLRERMDGDHIPLARRAAFAILRRVQALGIHSGFAAGARSHISSR